MRVLILIINQQPRPNPDGAVWFLLGLASERVGATLAVALKNTLPYLAGDRKGRPDANIGR